LPTEEEQKEHETRKKQEKQIKRETQDEDKTSYKLSWSTYSIQYTIHGQTNCVI
jgi:Zn-dependent M16 (insulinase) family peptidase